MVDSFIEHDFDTFKIDNKKKEHEENKRQPIRKEYIVLELEGDELTKEFNQERLEKFLVTAPEIKERGGVISLVSRRYIEEKYCNLESMSDNLRMRDIQYFADFIVDNKIAESWIEDHGDKIAHVTQISFILPDKEANDG